MNRCAYGMMAPTKHYKLSQSATAEPIPRDSDSQRSSLPFTGAGRRHCSVPVLRAQPAALR